MASANEWASILKKLGVTQTKKSIIQQIRAQQLTGQDIWDAFIETDPLIKAAANASKLHKVEDVDYYFREVSYAHMRSTFPSRARGRSIIGPRIVSAQAIKEEQERKQAEEKERKKAVPNKLVGQRINHTSFGPGTVVGRESSGIIIINFDSAGEKRLAYKMCIDNGFLFFDKAHPSAQSE